MLFRYLVALLFVFTMVPRSAIADGLGKAKALFDRYAALEAAFDPAAADLYAENASIRNKRIYPTGQIRELTIPAAQYKGLVRAAMPLAKGRGDYSTYSDTSFTPEGTNIRIKTTRYSVMKQYSSPLSVLVGPDSSGDWVILEELSESKP